MDMESNLAEGPQSRAPGSVRDRASRWRLVSARTTGHFLARGGAAEVFHPESAQDLPEPARRYLTRAIAAGTPLAVSVRLAMTGMIRLDPWRQPVPMQAEELLAPPHTLVWSGTMRPGVLRILGREAYVNGRVEHRRRLFGLVPWISGAGPDLERSSAGRLAIESILFPPALLPARGTVWEAVAKGTARAFVPVGDESLPVTITVDPRGRLLHASTKRWPWDPPDGRPRCVRFDIDRIDEELEFGGYRIPTRFRAGWQLGEADEEPILYPKIESAIFR